MSLTEAAQAVIARREAILVALVNAERVDPGIPLWTGFASNMKRAGLFPISS
jgi:hypothetical protein